MRQVGHLLKLRFVMSVRLSICLAECLSVRSEQLGPTGRIFMKFYIRGFFEYLLGLLKLN